jgi:tRNA(fMet)-specific endonuclease VapC
MVVLDTDHLTLLERRGSKASLQLLARLSTLKSRLRAITIITYEDQTRGRIAYVARTKSITQEVGAYAKLKMHLMTYRNILVLDFDEPAGKVYQQLRRLRIRIGTMDLKIAAIVIAHNATLLSRNLSDFGKVPGLRVEDWTVMAEGSTP